MPMQEGLVQVRGERVWDRMLIAYARAWDHPSKVRLIRWLARLSPLRVLLPAGGSVKVDVSDYMGWSLLVEGAYEPFSLRLATSLARTQSGICIDVGANFGLYTLSLASSTASKVVAIEADASNMARLLENISRQNIHNVIALSCAVSDCEGFVAIDPGVAGNSGTKSVALEQNLATANWTLSTKLNSVIDKFASPVDGIALLKIDVKGMEKRVLDGMDWSQKVLPKNIIVEFNSKPRGEWESIEELRHYFVERGYEVADVLGQPVAGDDIAESNVWMRKV